MEWQIYVFRIILIFVLALIFGLERQKSHKPVGFGTFIFVSIGACGLSILAISMPVDNPLPLLGAIVTGIGFLGAGALIKTTDKIFGFTTAAGIWLFSIIGLLIGVGYYLVSLTLYAILWICIFIDYEIEKGNFVSYLKRISVKLKGFEENDLSPLFKKFGIKKYKLISKKLNKESDIKEFVYLFEGDGANVRKFVEYIEEMDFVQEIVFE